MVVGGWVRDDGGDDGAWTMGRGWGALGVLGVLGRPRAGRAPCRSCTRREGRGCFGAQVTPAVRRRHQPPGAPRRDRHDRGRDRPGRKLKLEASNHGAGCRRPPAPRLSIRAAGRNRTRCSLRGRVVGRCGILSLATDPLCRCRSLLWRDLEPSADRSLQSRWQQCCLRFVKLSPLATEMSVLGGNKLCPNIFCQCGPALQSAPDIASFSENIACLQCGGESFLHFLSRLLSEGW